MPQNPSILVIPTGAQYFQAPDGTTVYAEDGSPVDLTGKALTVAPKRDGANASITAAAAGVVTVAGLYNVQPTDVGATLVLANCFEVGNNGEFVIVAVAAPNQVDIANAAGAFPDDASGAIRWAVRKGSDLAEGDPLSEVAAEALPLTIVTPTTGPARFADFDPTVQPMTVSTEAGLFGKVQHM